MPATASKTGTKPTIKILYGESDQQVLFSHAAEFKKAGHHVTTAVDRQGIQNELRRDAFDLVILGPTMSKDDRHHLPYMVKESSCGNQSAGHACRNTSPRSGCSSRLRNQHGPAAGKNRGAAAASRRSLAVSS